MSNLVEEYQSLLKASESLQTLDATLHLLERATGLRLRVQGVDLTIRKIEEEWENYESSWKRLPEFIREADEEGFERAKQKRLAARAQGQDRGRFVRVTWYLGTLPRNLSLDNLPDSQYSFIVDTLLLLFHQAYFVLLPRLKDAGWVAEEKDLVASFFAFANFVPDIAERFRIDGLAHQAGGAHQDALVSFFKSLRATHVDEHVFMTRLQTFWMTLLDAGQFREARDLLLEMLPMIPMKHLEEIQEMITDTFEEFGNAGAKDAKRRRRLGGRLQVG